MSDEIFDLRDQLSIDTPELVGIELPLAGIGSRCLAMVFDSVVQSLFLVVVMIAAFTLVVGFQAGLSVAHKSGAGDPAKWAIAIIFLAPFLLQWGYFTLFEAFWNGQTPGKRLIKLRVIQQSGRPIGLFESMTRNLLRIIDMLPGVYLVGAICIFATRRQQRLGDLVAGTLVVHSVPLETPMLPEGTRTFTAPALEQPLAPAPARSLHLPADAVARLSSEDLKLVESFLARRLDLPLEVRANLAARLAGRMTSAMRLEMPSGISHETFLEGLVEGMRELGTFHS